MEGGYDPSLYASTGSWAGMPYDAPSYGGYAPAYAPGPAPVQYAQPYAPMPARPAYGGGPMYGGYAEPAPYYPPPYGGGYGGGGYAPRGRRGPPMYDMPYMDGPPPGPPRQKVYGVRKRIAVSHLRLNQFLSDPFPPFRVNPPLDRLTVLTRFSGACV